VRIERRETTKKGVVQITTLDERWYLRESDGATHPSSTWVCYYAPKGVGFENFLKKYGDEAEQIKHLAGERGSRIHNVIAALITDKINGKTPSISIDTAWPDANGDMRELTPDEVQAVISFIDWWKETQPEPIAGEQMCWSEEPAYAGTLDFKYKKDGLIWLVDFKTSKDVYLSHEIQLSSYKHTPEGACDRMAILQVGYARNKKGWKFTEIEDKFDLFLSAYSFWKQENENKHPKQYEFPTILTI